MNLQEFTTNPEPLLATVAGLLARDGSATEVAILANGTASMAQTDYDNWDGGMDGFSIDIVIQKTLFYQIWSQRELSEQNILSVAREVARGAEQQYIARVSILVKVEGSDNWREQAKGWLEGKGVNNQGRVRSDNVAGKICDGLLFRSQPEIFLYIAFKSVGISFAPLPVFVKGGQS
jgi:hypothetical protein